MLNNTNLYKDTSAQLIKSALDLGAYKANVINAKDLSLDRSFRDICASNACGMYGRCYMCPPDVGNIDELMAEIGLYDFALVYQTVTELEDSFDFEGMTEAKKLSIAIALKLRGRFNDMNIKKALHLGAGGCGVCEKCAKQTNEPCRAPKLALPSLESYGVNVYELARSADMKYINGQNTVTYFGAVLFSLECDTARVIANGKDVTANCGQTLSEIVKVERLCGGHGSCGKCKVIATGALSELTAEEKRLLTADELARDIRLACTTRILGECEVRTLSVSDNARIVTDGDLPEFEIKPVFNEYGVAVDVGTTTLAACLYDTKGALLARTARLNPQSQWGADVVSRIEAALDGKADALALAIRNAINDIVTELADTSKISTDKIDGAVITGNTVMLSLLTNTSVEPFSHAPFDAKELFGTTFTANELGLYALSENTPIYLPPCISAFVGADTTCAVIATQLCGKDTAMLADIGTNGEMALWQDGKLTVCSTAAGPAFEGVGISMGMRGADGAIDRVTLKDGVLDAHVLGDVAPVGICGSGLIDAAARMLELEVLDESGYLEDEPFVIAPPVSLTGKDIRMLQLAKSAICAGLVTLIKDQGVSFADISALYVAGGFGRYLDKQSAARIGLLPSVLAERTRAVGNSALIGASMLILNGDMRAEAQALARHAVTLELSTSKVFSDCFMSGMMLCET